MLDVSSILSYAILSVLYGMGCNIDFNGIWPMHYLSIMTHPFSRTADWGGMLFPHPLYVLLAAALLLTTCQEPTSKSTAGSLTGVIRDQNSSWPIAEAEVQALEHLVSDTTDSLGVFFFDSIGLGINTLVVTKALYHTLTVSIDVIPGPNEAAFFLDLVCNDDTLVVNDRLYIKTDGQWYRVEQGSKFQVNNSVITVKFREDVSPDQIASLNASKGVQVLRTNILDFVDLQIPGHADPICMVLEYLDSDLVYSAEANTIGSYTIPISGFR